MKKRESIILIFLAISLFISIDSFSQSNRFIYDPMFWGDGLKLTFAQRKKIETINSEFYSKLRTIEKGTSSYQNQINEYLRERSNLIKETFHNRQKRRWERIVAGFSA